MLSLCRLIFVVSWSMLCPKTNCRHCEWKPQIDRIQLLDDDLYSEQCCCVFFVVFFTLQKEVDQRVPSSWFLLKEILESHTFNIELESIAFLFGLRNQTESSTEKDLCFWLTTSSETFTPRLKQRVVSFNLRQALVMVSNRREKRMTTWSWQYKAYIYMYIIWIYMNL